LPSLRPPQPPTPARDAFAIQRAPVADGLELAYVREGVGGYPLLLVHGYPETKRIWCSGTSVAGCSEATSAAW
jgi:hypothetical protein